MTYNLELTQEARLQYLEILNYYLEFESLERALMVEGSFSSIFSKIRKNPFAFKQYEESGQPHKNKRRAVIHNTYIIVFEIFSALVIIIDIYHARRSPSDHSII